MALCGKAGRLFVLLAAAFSAAACVTMDPTVDVELTWDQAFVRVPGLIPVSLKEQRERQIAELPPGTTFPTVIYMHGGGGLSPYAYKDIKIVQKAGFAVIALNSYARTRPSNPGNDLNYTCPHGDCWAIDRNIFNFRNAELKYALEQVRLLPWVDQNNLFGWGHSEGTYAMAAYPGAIFKARIITGGGCAWGFAAEEPTLAVIARNDAYVARHRLKHTRPSTCKKKSGNASNLTYLEVPGNTHNGAQTKAGKKALKEFLYSHITSAKAK
ncbi:MAG: hypothetical protein ISR44_08450 [Rhodospirillales bacterium]|nr:hypothetical protein [Rhodospirillales bacterium]